MKTKKDYLPLHITNDLHGQFYEMADALLGPPLKVDKSSENKRRKNNVRSFNETITDDLVSKKFSALGYFDNSKLRIERRQTSTSRINKLLQNASKKGSGKGYPDFIITQEEENDFVCVIECKADVTKHRSENLDKFCDYAVDGAKLYADYLSKEMDVLYIGVSGQTEEELKVSHFLKLKNKKEQAVFNNELLGFNSYLDQYRQERFRVDYDNLIKYTKTLNKTMHAKLIPENNRAVLFSGILIALEDQTFYNTYSGYSDARRLSDFLVESITQKLEYSNIQQTRVYEMQQSYNFIKSHTTLIDKGYLIELVNEIHQEVRPFIKSNEYIDILSHCYVEFLKYANNDRTLGIVLTPAHIAELFCEIANVNRHSVVFDNCCGTGSFLVAAMKKMVEDAKEDKASIEVIKNKQLVGIEFQDHIFTLGVSNMIIHGDGKTNIVKGDCFTKINEIRKFSPTVGLLNPPYNDGSGIDELKFIENNLSVIEKNGIVVAIVPMSCALYQSGQGLVIKERLLEKHTLEAVMSMPDDLFYPLGVVTCVMVFKAHIPHNDSKRKTWFGYWKNDGFIKVKHRGRVDVRNKWGKTLSHWLEMYRDREVHAGESVMHKVTADDEWCAEAYMETDYSKITQADFEKVVRNYAIFKLLNIEGTRDENGSP